jgi:hypothetical protein
MLTNPSTHNVAVANAEKNIRLLSDYAGFYQATQSFARGVIEGSRVFHLWQSKTA